jgi:hypothetical protein
LGSIDTVFTHRAGVGLHRFSYLAKQIYIRVYPRRLLYGLSPRSQIQQPDSIFADSAFGVPGLGNIYPIKIGW